MIIFVLYQSMFFGLVLSRYIYVDPSIATSIPNYARKNNFTPFRNDNNMMQMIQLDGFFESQNRQVDGVLYNNHRPDGINMFHDSLKPTFTGAPVEEPTPDSLERQTNDLLDFIQQRTNTFNSDNSGFEGDNRRSDIINQAQTYFPNNYYTQDVSANQSPKQQMERPRYNNEQQFHFNDKTSNIRSQIFVPSQNPMNYPNENNKKNEYPTPIIKKHVYFHVAPLEPTPTPNPEILTPRKNYKIIFIRTPSQEPDYATRLKLQRAAQQNEEKTLIYVLSKKPEEPHLAPTNYEPSKPEVFFIKYKNRIGPVTDAATSLIDQSIVNGKGKSDDSTSTEAHRCEETVDFQESRS